MRLKVEEVLANGGIGGGGVVAHVTAIGGAAGNESACLRRWAVGLIRRTLLLYGLLHTLLMLFLLLKLLLLKLLTLLTLLLLLLMEVLRLPHLSSSCCYSSRRFVCLSCLLPSCCSVRYPGSSICASHSCTARSATAATVGACTTISNSSLATEIAHMPEEGADNRFLGDGRLNGYWRIQLPLAACKRCLAFSSSDSSGSCCGIQAALGSVEVLQIDVFQTLQDGNTALLEEVHEGLEVLIDGHDGSAGVDSGISR